MSPPALDAQQLAQLAALNEALALEMANRPDMPPDATRANSNELDASRGAIRLHSEMDDNDGLPTSLADDPTAPYTLEQGRAFKRFKNLSGQSDSDADLFLRKTCQDYAHAALLSHKSKNYRNSKDNPTIARTIVSTMRALGVADMPPSMETGRCEVLMKVVGKALINKRYHIKNQIFASLTGDSVDIATLTRNCIGTSSAKATAALYQRIAFLRKIAVEHKSVSIPEADAVKDDAKDKFWPAVDAQLAVYQHLGVAQQQVMFEAAYRKDVETYGQPDNTIPLTLMQDVDAWLTTLNMAMEK
ncbi:hypothetical protein B0H11DRAFT_2353041 [Mycena galericulata]|nr:hypothetical protein B0H11DRAFT_2353041 [Mycena galericulata]